MSLFVQRVLGAAGRAHDKVCRIKLRILDQDVWGPHGEFVPTKLLDHL